METQGCKAWFMPLQKGSRHRKEYLSFSTYAMRQWGFPLKISVLFSIASSQRVIMGRSSTCNCGKMGWARWWLVLQPSEPELINPMSGLLSFTNQSTVLCQCCRQLGKLEGREESPMYSSPPPRKLVHLPWVVIQMWTWAGSWVNCCMGTDARSTKQWSVWTEELWQRSADRCLIRCTVISVLQMVKFISFLYMQHKTQLSNNLKCGWRDSVLN